MRVVSINVGVTKNLGDYESARVDLEASPGDTQTADELFQEMLVKVGEMLPQVTNKPATPPNKSAKKKSAKKKPAAKKAAEPEKSVSAGQPAVESDPDVITFEPDAPNVSLDDAKKTFKNVIASGNVETLHKRFNEFRSTEAGYRSVMSGEQWETAINKVHKRYKELVDTSTDPEIVESMSKVIVGERMALNNS